MKNTIYVIGLIVGILGVVGTFISIPFISTINQYLVMAGFVILAIGYMTKRK